MITYSRRYHWPNKPIIDGADDQMSPHVADLAELIRDALTELLADLNALHPFREGNGRTQRAFLAQLARAAEHPIRWSAMDPMTNGEASRAAHRGDSALLRAMLDELVDRTPGST